MNKWFQGYARKQLKCGKSWWLKRSHDYGNPVLIHKDDCEMINFYTTKSALNELCKDGAMNLSRYLETLGFRPDSRFKTPVYVAYNEENMDEMRIFQYKTWDDDKKDNFLPSKDGEYKQTELVTA